MRICVLGAGAIGGLLAARLAEAGEDVTVVARGAHLAAMREHGLTLLTHGEKRKTHVKAAERLGSAGPQDVLILAVKAHQLAAVAAEVSAVTGPETVLLTAQNGIPWWYFFRHGGRYEGTHLDSVDPGGIIALHLDPARVVGSVLYLASEVEAPGVIRHIEGDRISVGELDGSETSRITMVAEHLRGAGFNARIAKDLRSEIWVKLWGNCTFNPLSALTHATLAAICRFPLSRELVSAMMEEAQAVGEKLGVRFPLSLGKRIEGAEAVGEHKTSMLQDVEAGRAIELEALLGSVLELGRLTGTATPHLRAVYACAALLEHTIRAEHGRLRIERMG